MKTSSVLLALPCFILFILSSCEKEDKENIQTINVTLLKNQSYVFDVPESKSGTAYSISTQASHYSVSQLDQPASGEQLVYTYTPAVDYTGTDYVMLSNGDDKNGGHKKGQCNWSDSESESGKKIRINFNVVETNSQ